MELFSSKSKKDDRLTNIQNEIKSLQLRKSSLVGVVDNDILTFENEKNNIFNQAGQKAYTNWFNHLENDNSLDEFWVKIQETEKEIELKKAKKADIESRYDEEISMLQQGISIATKGTPITNNEKPVNGAQLTCPSCGAKIDADSKFCEKCGTKLK